MWLLSNKTKISDSGLPGEVSRHSILKDGHVDRVRQLVAGRKQATQPVLLHAEGKVCFNVYDVGCAQGLSPRSSHKVMNNA